MRTDARRNRERIVAAALDLFAERGPGVGMDEIARAAGLGVGTLYRHFPDRRALVEEIAMSALRRLRERIEALCEAEEPRWDVLTRVVWHCAAEPLALIKSLTGAHPGAEERLRLQDEVDRLLADLVKRAQDEGAVRRDLAPAEVLEVFAATVCRPGAGADDVVIKVMLDGLKRPEDA